MYDTIFVKHDYEVIELYTDMNSVKNDCFKYIKKTRSDQFQNSPGVQIQILFSSI